MPKNNNWFVSFFEDSKTVKAIARFVSLVVVLWGLILFFDGFKNKITPPVIHLTMSAFALIVCVYSLNFILNKMYGKLGNSQRIFRHPVLRYRRAIVKAIKLSAIDDSYFISLVWLKFCRIISSILIFCFLSVYLLVNDHSHLLVQEFFGVQIIVHEMLDYVISVGIASSCFVIFWQLAEINFVARGTARVVNSRRNAMVRKRRARRL